MTYRVARWQLNTVSFTYPTLLLLAGEERMNRCVKLIPALQEIQFDNEQKSNRCPSQLPHQFSCRSCATSCSMASVHTS